MKSQTEKRHASKVARQKLRIGFVDLIDAAPLIVALECGFFADEGLSVVLKRQLGWGSIRDRLTFGDLDAAHALLGMPLFSQIGRDWFQEPLVAVMSLGAGGDAITLSRRLSDAGVKSAAGLAKYVQGMARGSDRIALGHVFNCSVHHYLLREWLAGGGLDPDRDVHLRVFPPNQLNGHMTREHVAGFCVGEPWNTLAERDGIGRIAAVTTDIVPNHPDKVLATTCKWAAGHEAILVSLIRATLRGCMFCDDTQNLDTLSEILSRAEYLNVPADLLRQSLELRGTQSAMRSFSMPATFPSKTHAAWMATQMIRWGHLPAESDVMATAERCADSSAYRSATESLGVSCPAIDFPPMQLRHGEFDAAGLVQEDDGEIIASGMKEEHL